MQHQQFAHQGRGGCSTSSSPIKEKRMQHQQFACQGRGGSTTEVTDAANEPLPREGDRQPGPAAFGRFLPSGGWPMGRPTPR